MANSVQYSLPPEASSPASLTTSDSPTSTAREHYFSSARGARPPSHAHREQAKRSMAAGTSPRSVSTLPSSPSLRTSSNGSYGMVDICSLPAIRLARQVHTVHVYTYCTHDIYTKHKVKQTTQAFFKKNELPWKLKRMFHQLSYWGSLAGTVYVHHYNFYTVVTHVHAPHTLTLAELS